MRSLGTRKKVKHTKSIIGYREYTVHSSGNGRILLFIKALIPYSSKTKLKRNDVPFCLC